MSFNYGREEKKWRLWKEAEEKQLRSLGVSEDTIEQLHTRCRISKGMVIRPRLPKMRRSFLFTRPSPFHHS